MVEADDAAATTITTTTTSFPVVLFDGEREMDVGNIKLHPDLVFKEFQMMLSQLIGISYNNLTTYLVDSKKSKISPDRRKVLITGKANFALIVRETNCYFLVVLKRSRRDRRRKPVVKQSDFGFHFAPSMSISPDLSQINPNWNRYDLNDVPSISPDLSQVNWNRNWNLNRDLNDTNMCVPNPYYYEDRFHDLLMQREDYMNMILNPLNSGYRFDSPSNTNFPRIEDAYPRVQSNSNHNPDRSLCEECTVAQKQGKYAEFHLCVYDEVVVGRFRSPAGPISRPRAEEPEESAPVSCGADILVS